MTDLAVLSDSPVTRVTTGFAFPGVEFSEGRLEFTEDLSFERWSRLGEVLQRIARSIDFWLGDWAIYGEVHFGLDYLQAISEDSGYAVESVRVSQWVAERIAPEQRRRGLSFWHHRAVAALEPDEQAVYLDKAESEGLTSKRLYELVHPDRHERAVEVGCVGEDDVKQTLRPWLAGRDLVDATEAVMGLLTEKGMARA